MTRQAAVLVRLFFLAALLPSILLAGPASGQATPAAESERRWEGKRHWVVGKEQLELRDIAGGGLIKAIPIYDYRIEDTGQVRTWTMGPVKKEIARFARRKLGNVIGDGRFAYTIKEDSLNWWDNVDGPPFTDVEDNFFWSYRHVSTFTVYGLDGEALWSIDALNPLYALYYPSNPSPKFSSDGRIAVAIHVDTASWGVAHAEHGYERNWVTAFKVENGSVVYSTGPFHEIDRLFLTNDGRFGHIHITARLYSPPRDGVVCFDTRTGRDVGYIFENGKGGGYSGISNDGVCVAKDQAYSPELRFRYQFPP